jgi:hypothetical protein
MADGYDIRLDDKYGQLALIDAAAEAAAPGLHRPEGDCAQDERADAHGGRDGRGRGRRPDRRLTPPAVCVIADAS